MFTRVAALFGLSAAASSAQAGQLEEFGAMLKGKAESTIAHAIAKAGTGAGKRAEPSRKDDVRLPLGSSTPSGQKARLIVEVTQAGDVARSLRLEMSLIPEAPTAYNLLAGDMAADGAASQAYEMQLNARYAPDIGEMGRLAAAVRQECRTAPTSAACSAAKREYGAADARNSAMAERAKRAIANAPSLNAHRFQRWIGDLKGGCGRAVSRVGKSERTIAAAPGVAIDAPGFPVCLTELVIDRDAGKAFLLLKPYSYVMAGQEFGTFNLTGIVNSSAVQADRGWAGPSSVILRDLNIDGSSTSFAATGTIPYTRGAPARVALRFDQLR